MVGERQVKFIKIWLDVHPPCISEIHWNCVKLIQRIIERNKKTLWTCWWIFLRLKAKRRSLETQHVISSEPCDFSNGFVLIIWLLISAHGLSWFLFYADVFNSGCLVPYFLLFQIILYPSLQALVTMPHRCNKVMEVSNKMCFFTLITCSIIFPNSGRFSVYISVFLSLVEGDNLPQSVQETTPGNFLCFCIINAFWAGVA